MAYHIHAWLERGNPRLRVVDLSNGSICLRWDYDAGPTKSSDRKEIQRLFKEFLLLTIRQGRNDLDVPEIVAIPVDTQIERLSESVRVD